MSGHSHFSTIKHKKALTDAKKSKIFSKIFRQITIAVKEKGSNPETNGRLKMAIEQAREVNMPSENVERAIKKSSGEAGSESLEEIIVEAYGPGGIAIIIDGITDNRNRSLGEIKQILNQYGGKFAGEGSVKWMFERKGYLSVDNSALNQSKESLELTVIEAGADDVKWDKDTLNVYSKPDELEKVKKELGLKNIKFESASLAWIAKDDFEVSEKEKESCEKLFEALDEDDSIQNIYSNLK